MNPLLLSGPAFLLFYLVFGVTLLFILHKYLRSQQRTSSFQITSLAADPYKVAYLRGGKLHAAAVATLSLHDRGLLLWEQGKLKCAQNELRQTAKRPIEKALFNHYAAPKAVARHVRSPALDAACADYQRELASYGLLRTSATLGYRLLPCLGALLLMVGLAYKKTVFAHAHGHYNTDFMWVLVCPFFVAVVWMFCGRLTGGGAQLLADLQALFALLRQRAALIHAGGETTEVALLAAVFGLEVVAASQFPFVRELMPKQNDSCSDSGCSSSGSGCGSSCGGGGGCGGCGS